MSRAVQRALAIMRGAYEVAQTAQRDHEEMAELKAQRTALMASRPLETYLGDLDNMTAEYPAPWRLSDPDVWGHHDILDAAGNTVPLPRVPVFLERGLVAAVNLSAAVRA